MRSKMKIVGIILLVVMLYSENVFSGIVYGVYDRYGGGKALGAMDPDTGSVTEIKAFSVSGWDNNTTYDPINKKYFYTDSGPSIRVVDVTSGSSGTISTSSWWSGMEFEYIIPEPCTISLIAFGSLALLRKRKI